MKRVKQLKYPALRVLAQFDAARKCFALGIQQNHFHVPLLAHRRDAGRDFHQHPFVQQILRGAVEPQVRDLAFDAEFYKLKIVNLGRVQGKRPEFLDLHIHPVRSPFFRQLHCLGPRPCRKFQKLLPESCCYPFRTAPAARTSDRACSMTTMANPPRSTNLTKFA